MVAFILGYFLETILPGLAAFVLIAVLTLNLFWRKKPPSLAVNGSLGSSGNNKSETLNGFVVSPAQRQPESSTAFRKRYNVCKNFNNNIVTELEDKPDDIKASCSDDKYSSTGVTSPVTGDGNRCNPGLDMGQNHRESISSVATSEETATGHSVPNGVSCQGQIENASSCDLLLNKLPSFLGQMLKKKDPQAATKISTVVTAPTSDQQKRNQPKVLDEGASSSIKLNVANSLLPPGTDASSSTISQSSSALAANKKAVAPMDSLALQEELLGLTKAIVLATAKSDFSVYERLCDKHMTQFTYETRGNLVALDTGMNKFLLTASASNPKQNSASVRTTLLNPKFVLLNADAACISYTCLIQFMDRQGNAHCLQSHETRIWKHENKRWSCLHLHQSGGPSMINTFS